MGLFGLIRPEVGPRKVERRQRVRKRKKQTPTQRTAPVDEMDDDIQFDDEEEQEIEEDLIEFEDDVERKRLSKKSKKNRFHWTILKQDERLRERFIDLEASDWNGLMFSSVTPFYTFDPLQGTEASLFLEMLNDCHKGIDRLAQLDSECPMIATKLSEQGASFSQGRGDVSWDDATIVFVALRATEADGAPSEPLERGISIERLGRFPMNEGNSIAYLRAHLILKNPVMKASNFWLN